MLLLGCQWALDVMNNNTELCIIMKIRKYIIYSNQREAVLIMMCFVLFFNPAFRCTSTKRLFNQASKKMAFLSPLLASI